MYLQLNIILVLPTNSLNSKEKRLSFILHTKKQNKQTKKNLYHWQGNYNVDYKNFQT